MINTLEDWFKDTVAGIHAGKEDHNLDDFLGVGLAAMDYFEQGLSQDALEPYRTELAFYQEDLAWMIDTFTNLLANNIAKRFIRPMMPNIRQVFFKDAVTPFFSADHTFLLKTREEDWARGIEDGEELMEMLGELDERFNRLLWDVKSRVHFEMHEDIFYSRGKIVVRENSLYRIFSFEVYDGLAGYKKDNGAYVRLGEALDNIDRSKLESLIIVKRADRYPVYETVVPALMDWYFEEALRS